MIGRGDRDDIQFLVLEGLADVLKTFGRIAAFLPNFLAPRLKQASIRIDQVGDLNIFLAEILIDMSAALPVDAGDTNSNHVVGPQYAA